jgi:predicted chitinase
LDGRTVSLDGYRFGFQNQEKDDEIKGEGNSINYTFRMHDPRLGRFFAVDPLEADYPFYSSYQFSGNRLIDMLELEGLEPGETGSYTGQGAKAPKINDKGEAEGPNVGWVWKDDKWNQQDVLLTQTDLIQLFPNGKTANLMALEITINIKGSAYGISNNNELAHYLGQVGHETGGFCKENTSENTYYSSLIVVQKAFGTSSNIYKSVQANPNKYLKNRQNFANLAYANKLGNGDESSGDGYKFRGRGFIQLTGKTHYSNFTKSYNSLYGTNYDFVKDPDIISTNPSIGVASSLYYFNKFTLPTIKNGGSFSEITRTVNARGNGLEDRKKYYDLATKILNE